MLAAAFVKPPKTVTAGSSYSMDVTLTPTTGSTFTKVQMTIGSDRGSKAVCDSNGKRPYPEIATITHGRTIAVTLTVPSSLTGGHLVITANVDTQETDPFKATATMTVKKKPAPTPTHSSGSATGTGSNTGSTTPINNLPTGGLSTTTPPPTSGSAVLPSIAPQTPTTAPDPASVSQTNDAPSMRSTAEKSDQLSFGELASTQAAWLAALLVAFFLLLTQVKLGKATVRDIRVRGAHRRPRNQNRAH